MWHPRASTQGWVCDTPGAVRQWPGEGFLANTRRCNRGRVGRKFQMLEDLPDHLAVREGGDDPPRPLRTPRAARHVQCKHLLQQPRPAPVRRRRAGLLLLHALLTRCGDDRPAQLTVWPTSSARPTLSLAPAVSVLHCPRGKGMPVAFAWASTASAVWTLSTAVAQVSS
jgi:hypothetical protein